MKRLLLLLALLTGCATRPPVVPAPAVDLPRYMGDWFVIANIPYWAEKDCYGSIERYRLQSDGLIDTTFLARKGGFQGKQLEAKSVARVTDKKSNARWQVLFLGGLIKVPLVILDVTPDYRSAVVVTPDRKLAWIFHRDPVMPARDYEAAVAVLKAGGIDVSRLVRVPQVPGN
ncbi:MAG: lipocalin family protein [Terrimicrobiaceae bacterium]